VINDLVYDVGMNNGDDTAYYLHRGFRVVAIDADAALVAAASRRFKQEIDRGQLTLLNLGITTEPGPLDFWICEAKPEWNSFNRKAASRNGLPHHSIKVPGQTFDWVLKNYGIPFYLKIDIEGSDALCLEALPANGDSPAYVSAELGNIEEFIANFEKLGYTRFKCISQYNFLPLQLPPAEELLSFQHWERLLRSPELFAKEIREKDGWIRLRKGLLESRRHGKWMFPQGSSGAFGEDTLGRWLTPDEARESMLYYSHPERNPLLSGWVDLHARKA
jgi:FkbM family methyltransferase